MRGKSPFKGEEERRGVGRGEREREGAKQQRNYVKNYRVIGTVNGGVNARVMETGVGRSEYGL